jgi:hypothetical protein
MLNFLLASTTIHRLFRNAAPMDGRLIAVATRRTALSGAVFADAPAANADQLPTRALIALDDAGDWDSLCVLAEPALPTPSTAALLAAEAARSATFPGGATCGHPLRQGEKALARRGLFASVTTLDCTRCDWYANEASRDSYCFVCRGSVHVAGVFLAGDVVVLLHLCDECADNELHGALPSLRFGRYRAGDRPGAAGASRLVTIDDF